MTLIPFVRRLVLAFVVALTSLPALAVELDFSAFAALAKANQPKPAAPAALAHGPLAHGPLAHGQLAQGPLAQAPLAHGVVGATGVPDGTLDFTPNGTQPGLQFAIDGAEACSNCHRGNTAVDQNLLPQTPWEGSMMANAARDPLFWAALDVANRDVPGIGDFCLRCHAPNAWLQGRVRKDGFGGTVNGTNGCLMQGDLDDLDDKVNDFQGLNCQFCHRIKPRGPSGQPPPLANANLWFDDADCATGPGPCRAGPYSYPSQTPVGTVFDPPHVWKEEPFFRDATYCAACHNVSSPDTSNGPLQTLILNDGTNTMRAFPLDRTFTEWRKSDFGTRLLRSGMESPAPGRPEGLPTCQSCHMPISTSEDARACVFTPSGARKSNLGLHQFAGANYWMVDVLKATYGGPDQLNREAAFDASKAAIVQNLTQNSATIQLSLAPLASGASNLSASVRITNLTGHKLPTGYAEGRRMWLQVRAVDANQQTVFESGAYNAASGVLTEDAQIKIYETLHGVWQRFGQTGACVVKDPATQRKLFNIALSNCILKDNRIPPLGFTGGNDVELRPVGYTYPETSPGSGQLVNFDLTQYSIPVPANAARPIRVTATLRFQVTTKEYIEFLRDEAQISNIPSENAMCGRTQDVGPGALTRGQFMFNLWTQHGRAPPLDMVSASANTVAALAKKRK